MSMQQTKTKAASMLPPEVGESEWSDLDGHEVLPLLHRASNKNEITYNEFSEISGHLRSEDCVCGAFYPAFSSLLKTVKKVSVDKRVAAYNSLADLIFMALENDECPDRYRDGFNQAIDAAKKLYADLLLQGSNGGSADDAREHCLMSVVALLALTGRTDAAEGLKYFVMHFPDLLND